MTNFRHVAAPPVFAIGPLLLVLGLAALAALLPGCGPRRSHPSTAPAEASVRPGINDPYINPDIEQTLARLETESREIFRERIAIAGDFGLAAGMSVADIGAGTGVLVELLGQRVGPQGRVYAVDIAPRFLDFIAERARTARLENIHTVLCPMDSVNLQPNSIDVAVLVDVYHHFEYPRASLASLRLALRPGGRLHVIDFIRIEGVTRQWVLDHVRAGEEVFTREIEEAGFEKLRDFKPKAPLTENYHIAFRKK